ncbi:MAG: class I SAM-dependent methyltransferase [Chitinophagales bacterium]|nr:class I SAM-dependent methyltransferase [Chitinophagales bacterium]
MKSDAAAAMLIHPLFDASQTTAWSDLGCGTGTFTMALTRVLPHGSIIHAVDTDGSALKKIPDHNHQTEIKKYHADFVADALPFQKLDGILMANSFHYVKEKTVFVKKIEAYLKTPGCFLMIEYDTDKANRWVPYPLGFQSLQAFFFTCGYLSVIKLHERDSIFNQAKLYAALIRK